MRLSLFNSLQTSIGRWFQYQKLYLSGGDEIVTRCAFTMTSSVSISEYAAVASCLGLAEVTVSEAPQEYKGIRQVVSPVLFLHPSPDSDHDGFTRRFYSPQSTALLTNIGESEMNALPSPHASFIGNSIPLEFDHMKVSFSCSIELPVLYSLTDCRGPAYRKGCERSRHHRG